MADMDHSSTSLHNSQGSVCNRDVNETEEILVLVAGDSNSRGSKLEFSEDEEILIVRMFNLVGERWTLIAGRIPGRTAEEIEKYWTSRYSSSQWKVGC